MNLNTISWTIIPEATILGNESKHNILALVAGKAKNKKKNHSGKYQEHAGMFQRPYQTNNNTAKNTDQDWSLVVTMATTIMATKLVQSMVH